MSVPQIATHVPWGAENPRISDPVLGTSTHHVYGDYTVMDDARFAIEILASGSSVYVFQEAIQRLDPLR